MTRKNAFQAAIAGLKHTPGAAFGSCRYKLASIAQHERLIEVFQAHDIGYFFYNGAGDSQDTAHKVGQISAALSYPVVCVGIPKNVDWAVADDLQRSARHIASETDVEQAYAVGSAAVNSQWREGTRSCRRFDASAICHTAGTSLRRRARR